MKIGEFAEKCQVSKDTVRYYMKIGLLVPNGKNAQYSFTERDYQDMQLILRMKQQNFSLDEIRKYMDIRRISTMVESESIHDVVDLLEKKKSDLERQIQFFQKICNSIDEDIADLIKENSVGENTGMPLRALPLLTCPDCGASLELENAALNNRYVFNAKLKCSCGYQAKIENGILKTDHLYEGMYDSPDLKRETYREVNRDFVNYFQKCSDFALEKLREANLKGKIVLEGHINSCFFISEFFKIGKRLFIYFN